MFRFQIKERDLLHYFWSKRVMKFIVIIVIIIMFVYWRLSNATNTEQWHNIIA